MDDREKAEQHFRQTLVWELDKRLRYRYRDIFLHVGLTDEDLVIAIGKNPGHEVVELLIRLYNKSGTLGLQQFYQKLQQLEEKSSLALIGASAAAILFHPQAKDLQNANIDPSTIDAVFLRELSEEDLEDIVDHVLPFKDWRNIVVEFGEVKYWFDYHEEKHKHETEKDLCMALFNKLASEDKEVKLDELVQVLKKDHIGLHSVAKYIEEAHFKVDFGTPSEIASLGPEVISAYHRALKDGKMKPFRSKLMLVGQAGAGKTSLLRAITQQHFDANESSTHVMDVCDVDVSQWRLISRITSDFYAAMAIQVALLFKNQLKREDMQTKVDEAAQKILQKLQQEHSKLNQKTKLLTAYDPTSGQNLRPPKITSTRRHSKAPFTFSTWDFAGQDIYYSIHPIFITDHAHYIVVFSLKEAADDLEANSANFIHYLDFWIKSISYYTSKARLFLVGTHADQITQNSTDTLSKISQQIEEKIFKDSEDYILAYNMLIPNSLDVLFFPVNNQRGFRSDGVQSLVAKLKQDMEYQHNSGFLSVEQPLRWLQMQEEIHVISANKSVVTYQELESLAIETCKIEATDVKNVLQYLHDVGQVIYYNDITDSNGNQLVIINPQWLIGCTKDLIPTEINININLSDFRKLKSGNTTIDVLEKIWASHDAKYLIELMKKFGLLCTSDGINFTVPFSKKIELPKWNHMATNQLICFFKFGQFLPEALFHYMVVHFVNTTNPKSNFRPEVNRYAAIVMIEDQRCFLQLIPPQHQIKLIIERKVNHVPAEVLKAIQDQIISLTELRVKNLSYKVLINCPQCFDQKNGMVVLDTPDYCTASPQCSLTLEEMQKIDMDWNKATNQVSLQNETVQQQEDNLLGELQRNLIWQLNDKLQHRYWELATRSLFQNITLLESKHPGNEVAALLLYLHKRDGSLKPFYQVLNKLEETSSLELIDKSPAKPLFM